MKNKFVVQLTTHVSGTINMKVDYKGHRIPINGVEDMGGLNFKKFTPAELLQYDFPNREDKKKQCVIGKGLEKIDLRTTKSVSVKQRTSQIFGSFANQVGGYEHVTFSVQDMYNAVDKERRSKGTDSRAALAYLRSLKRSDPTMYWKHTVDKQGRLKHLFWSDGRSQMDYNIFGDVLAFDATYKKNRYLCPLVVFSVVNHHNQTTVFATAIVANETEETYVWLLECLLEVMNGKMPKSVITDGDLAMKNAIRRGIPNAHHRLCAWHLIRNATSNNDMVTEYGVEDNHWVLDMYEKKEMWATAHIREAYAETIELLKDHYGHVKSKYEVQDERSDKMEGHNERYLQNPVIARTKGRGGNVACRAGNKRKKSQCGFCGIVGHNKQTCAAFKKQKKTVDKSDVDDDDDDDDEDDGGGDDDDDDDDYRG
ncbi:hypothetical protein TSUD_323520 [Trifolium subterraneum]|uniref:MULE transposase domain-containing protein n=1 Tax=Trifolium subterraneum TaxID=3900 RepID=A0A2Z6N3G0_TRISU|nr:hypothetical protein TSUD_323520 [Trifolium subterraneum]